MKDVKIISFLLLITGLSLYSCSKENDESGNSSSNKEKGHEYVDLGLPSGTLWATCNVGAPIPEYPGDYFAWGETETKNVYNEETYKWCTGWDVFTKYCIDSDDGGKVDNRMVLESADDAAHAKWGGKWHIPTIEQWKELMACCECIETTQNGTKGVAVIRNGKQIFLPVTGYKDGSSLSHSDYCNYWSSSMQEGSRNRVYYIYGDESLTIDYGRSIRYNGLPVRPVCSN